MDWKLLLVAGALLGLAPAFGATEDSQKLLLKQVFRAEQDEWPAVLVDHRDQLDDAFFSELWLEFSGRWRTIRWMMPFVLPWWETWPRKPSAAGPVSGHFNRGF